MLIISANCEDMSFLYFTSPGFLMEDLFTHLTALTLYLSRKFMHFIEDLALADFTRAREFSPLSSSSAETGSCSSSGAFLKLKVRCGDIFPLQGPTLCRHICGLTRGCFKWLTFHASRVYSELLGCLTRLRRTLKGSSDEIGWLERAENSPPVEDGTAEFLSLLQDIRRGQHSLPSCFVYLLIPGLFSNLSPLYFVNTKRFFSKMGLTCHIARIHSEASVEKNAWELRNYIEELYWGSGKRVMILGHSKGGVDAAAAISMYWAELRPMVAGLAVVQCPYAGSPIASDILRPGQIADSEARRLMEFLVCKLIQGDIRALEDLTYARRRKFLVKHKLPWDQLPLISFHTEAGAGPGVLATMSHIAHAELPWLPPFLSATGGLPVMVPLAAAMAVSAVHLRLRYGHTSDGLVARRDAEIPGSVAVRLQRKLDHAWMVYSSSKSFAPEEADASQMCEALLTLLVQLCSKKKPVIKLAAH